MMSREDLMFWTLLLGIANFILTWGVALYMYLANKNKATNARIDSLSTELRDTIDDHGNRLTKVESMPTHQDLSEWHEKTNQVAREVSELTGKVDGMNHLLTRLDEHLRRRT